MKLMTQSWHFYLLVIIATLSYSSAIKVRNVLDSNSDTISGNNDYTDAVEIAEKNYKAPEDGDYVNTKIIEDEKLDK